MKKALKISVAASKSYFQRALAISALAKGTSVLHQISWCNDSIAAKNIIEDLGSNISENKRTLSIKTEGLDFKNTKYTAGEAGLSVRMFSPIFALSDKKITFIGEGSLKTRPIQIISDALMQLGVQVETQEGMLPIKIKGKIKAGEIHIDGSLSSQLLTGLLIALPLLDGDSVINVSQLKSKPYVDMTLSIMKEFGVEVENEDYKIFRIKGHQQYKPTDYYIEGDWSGGAFFLVYGAVKQDVEIVNLDYRSQQADKAFLEALQKAGAKVNLNHKSVRVEKAELKAFVFDATECPDLFPPLVCLASQCTGVSEIKGISRLSYKESDRAQVLKQEFQKMGIAIQLKQDSMFITGGKIKPCIVDSHNDHRIAMLGGIMNLFCDGEITVKNKEAINKSYPNFFEDLKILSSFDKK